MKKKKFFFNYKYIYIIIYGVKIIIIIIINFKKITCKNCFKNKKRRKGMNE